MISVDGNHVILRIAGSPANNFAGISNSDIDFFSFSQEAFEHIFALVLRILEELRVFFQLPIGALTNQIEFIHINMFSCINIEQFPIGIAFRTEVDIQITSYFDDQVVTFRNPSLYIVLNLDHLNFAVFGFVKPHPEHVFFNISPLIESHPVVIVRFPLVEVTYQIVTIFKDMLNEEILPLPLIIACRTEVDIASARKFFIYRIFGSCVGQRHLHFSLNIQTAQLLAKLKINVPNNEFTCYSRIFLKRNQRTVTTNEIVSISKSTFLGINNNLLNHTLSGCTQREHHFTRSFTFPNIRLLVCCGCRFTSGGKLAFTCGQIGITL